MADAGVDQYTFHVEPCFDVPFVCRKVKEAGMKVGCIFSVLLHSPNCISSCHNAHLYFLKFLRITLPACFLLCISGECFIIYSGKNIFVWNSAVCSWVFHAFVDS